MWLPIPVATSPRLLMPFAPSIVIGVALRLRTPPSSAVAPIMPLAFVVPFAGPIVMEDPAALRVLPAPVARRPTCRADVAVVVDVVFNSLPSKEMDAPACDSAPIVEAAPRFATSPFAVICPRGPDAFNPTALAGATVITVAGGTVQAVFATTARVGQICASAGEGPATRANGTRSATTAILARARPVPPCRTGSKPLTACPMHCPLIRSAPSRGDARASPRNSGH